VVPNPPSIQERFFADLTCFGCGPANPKGLHLASFARNGRVVAEFKPWPEHDNGIGYLNGGIVATLLDCHSAAAVVVEADRQGWVPLPGARLSFVTAGLDVRYLRPSELDWPVELRAEIVSSTEPEIVVEVVLHADGKVRATGTAHWKRWRPR
jgi:acyl-coenzyme A thioesterase PaaI-like protein